MYHVLDRWGLPGQSPAGALRLESLHAAWLHHVPFENVSKLILSRGGRPEARRRSIRRFWIDHFRWGAGGTCFDLTASFAHLLTFAGFEPRFVFCRLPGRSERSHVALLVRAPADAKEEKDEVVHLVDVGFALPCPVPIPKGLVIRRSTRYYDIEVRRGVEGEFLVLTEDRRGVNYRYSFRPAPVSRPEFDEAWEDTFAPEAPYMKRLALGRFHEAVRYIYKGPSSLYLLSRSRHRQIEMDPPDTAALSRIFGVHAALIRSGITILREGPRSG